MIKRQISLYILAWTMNSLILVVCLWGVVVGFVVAVGGGGEEGWGEWVNAAQHNRDITKNSYHSRDGIHVHPSWLHMIQYFPPQVSLKQPYR